MKTATCPSCDRQFTFTRPRKFCDRRCAATVSAQVRGVVVWESNADFYLEKFAGSLPLPDLVKRFNAAAKNKGWAQRSETAIKVRLKRLGLSCKASFDNFSTIELARTLNIKRDRAELWIEKGLLPYRKVARNVGAIRATDFRLFVEQHWQRLAEVDLEGLAWLGVKTELIEAIAALPPCKHGKAMPVRRTDTGEVFHSIKEASRKCYVDRTGIRLSVEENRPVSGIKWEVAA